MKDAVEREGCTGRSGADAGDGTVQPAGSGELPDLPRMKITTAT